MHQPRYSSRRRKKKVVNPLQVAIALVAVVFMVLVILLVARGCSQENPVEPSPTASAEPTDDSDEPTTNPTTSPVSHLTEEDFVIYLDPGHGYSDGGCTSIYTSVAETDINLAIALKVRTALQNYGFTVLMTRESDTVTEELKQRRETENWRTLWPTYRMNEFPAPARPIIINESNPDISISIHCDSYPKDTSIYRSTIHYDLNNNPEITPQLATYVLQAIKESYPDRKVVFQTNELALTTQVNAPALLVECGFMSNQQDCANLTDETWQQTFAESIAKGVYDYFNWVKENNITIGN